VHPNGRHSTAECREIIVCSSRFSQLTSKTPKPLLILGFRAGALRHPDGDLLSDKNLNHFLNKGEQHSNNYHFQHFLNQIKFTYFVNGGEIRSRNLYLLPITFSTTTLLYQLYLYYFYIPHVL
jgi:hypothetical protein